MNIKNIYEYYRHMYNYVIIVKEKIVRSVDQQLFHLKKIKMLNLLSHYNPIYTSFFSIVLTLFYNETQAKWGRHKCIEKFYNLRKNYLRKPHFRASVEFAIYDFEKRYKVRSLESKCARGAGAVAWRDSTRVTSGVKWCHPGT